MVKSTWYCPILKGLHTYQILLWVFQGNELFKFRISRFDCIIWLYLILFTKLLTTLKKRINYEQELFCFFRNVLHMGRISSSSNVATAVQWPFSIVLVLHIFVTVVIATMTLSLTCQGHNYHNVLQVTRCYFAFIVYLKERFCCICDILRSTREVCLCLN